MPGEFIALAPFIMVPTIVAIVFGAKIAQQYVDYLTKQGGSGKVLAGQAEELLREMRSLREELAQTRQQNNDVVLSFDATLDRIDQRVSTLERTAVNARAASTDEQVQVAGRRG